MKLKNQSLFRQQCYIDGLWCDGDTTETLDVYNPSTRECLGTVPKLGASETCRAIEAAQHSWPQWKEKTAKERAVILRRWYQLMLDNKDDLATILTAEQGKPLTESVMEVMYGASYIEWFAEEGKRIYGDTIPQPSQDKRIIVTKEPVGVVAAITPWNFPNAMITRKCGPALAAGCPIVVKPASATPYSALALAVLAEQAGIPEGVFNVVTGSASAIGGEITRNPIVRKLSFTGSTEVGKILIRECADTVKKVSMELGGNAPFIVFDDADIDKAVQGTIASKFRNTGQTCVCVNRILVQDAIHDEYVEKLAIAVQALKVADGFEVGSQQGPLIDVASMNFVQSLVDDAVKKGAKIVVGGKPHVFGGSFFEPTVLVGVTSDMACASNEIFGPLASIYRFKTEAEAVQMANDTEFGLASYFYSRDVHRVFRVAEALEYGIVGINEGSISTEVAPFGGVKESGNGREGSKYGIEDYLELKYLCLGGM